MTMTRRWLWLSVCAFLLPAAMPRATAQAPGAPIRRNVIIFVADGLRHDSVNERDTPALWRVRTEGVHFRNSHSLYPTFTTPNASAIATGHGLGDTGDFGNSLWVGYRTFDTGNFNAGPGTPVPFIENDQVLADLDDHYGGNYLGHDTLLSLARAHGYHTAAIGKVGPAAIQDIAVIAPKGGAYPPPASSIIIDDATGTAAGLPLPPRLAERLAQLNLPPETPARNNGYRETSRYNNSFSGDRLTGGTLAANVVQQQWFADVTTRAILPMFLAEPEKPFALLFWSRDPDSITAQSRRQSGQSHPGD